MGAGNVAVVLQCWSRALNDKPFRALVQMALTSKDEDRTPRYWAGWAMIARAVGAIVPDGCEHCRGCSECQAAQRAARRAIASLVECGVVKQASGARKGWNAEYELHIHVTTAPQAVSRYGTGVRRKPVDNPPSGGLDADDRRTLSVLQTPDAERPADAGRSASTLPDAERPAEEEQEKLQEHVAGKTSPQVPMSPVYPQPRVEVIDQLGAVPPATRPTGPVQAGIWPHAVPDPAPDPRDRQPSPEDAAGITAIRDVLAARRAARTATLETTCSPTPTSTGSPPPDTPYAPTGTAPTSAPT